MTASPFFIAVQSFETALLRNSMPFMAYVNFTPETTVVGSASAGDADRTGAALSYTSSVPITACDCRWL